MELQLFQVDAFTAELFAGNPAGVVLNADGLNERQMQNIARELNNSETAFIFNTPGADYDIEVRFFTPTQEVPICGHATVSAHYVYAKSRSVTDGTVIQKTGAGKLPVTIAPEEGDISVLMTQGKVEFGAILSAAQVESLLLGTGLPEGALVTDLPVQIVSTGHSKVMVPLKSKALLEQVALDESKLVALSREIGCNGFYLFTLESEEEGVLAAGRMFAPAIGITEDPVTGNANGPLGAYLTHYGSLPASMQGSEFSIAQGEQMGRKGYMQVRVFADKETVHKVQIKGRARIVFETRLKLEA
ncbi:PhzF family isomerase [Shewanella algae]|uniref:PhzF family isomerase n=1 Tax=Shewanella algae TaxID=38313 RepID=UPI003AAAF692